MTQKMAALGLVIGLSVAVITGAGYMLVYEPGSEMTNMLVGAVVMAFGAGTKAVIDKISQE
jgi:hypothetical protein